VLRNFRVGVPKPLVQPLNPRSRKTDVQTTPGPVSKKTPPLLAWNPSPMIRTSNTVAAASCRTAACRSSGRRRGWSPGALEAADAGGEQGFMPS
jgi:hypothetical protein